jgi:transposase
MDRAYEGNETRQLALDLGFIPVVPPLRTRVEPWQYDRAMYKRRNEVERLFRRLKGYHRIFSRFEKLDVMFTAFSSASPLSRTACSCVIDPALNL